MTFAHPVDTASIEPTPTPTSRPPGAALPPRPVTKNYAG